jgi:hypothetical protein
MVLMPATSEQAYWHAQLYRMAYQRAVADREPPRYMQRFFAVWN